MNLTVKNSVFDGTLLEDFPVTFEWRTLRPKNVYHVGRKGIFMRNYHDWYAVENTEQKDTLRKMFMHDFGHMMLYARRDDWWRLGYNNFDLRWYTDWDQVTLVYHRLDQFIDEVRITAFEKIANSFHENGRVLSYSDFLNEITDGTKRMHFKHPDEKNGDELVWNVNYIKERIEILQQSYWFWMDDLKIEGIQSLAKDVRQYLTELNKNIVQ
jgi:hypothetical protein